MVLDSINGQPLTPTSMQVLKASSVARFSGHIETPDAAFANTFSGVVNAVLSDKMDTITCVNNTAPQKHRFTKTAQRRSWKSTIR